MPRTDAASQNEASLTFEQCVELCLHVPPNEPVIIVGPPGIGKSHVPQEVARRLNAKYWAVYLATLEVVEANGLPHLARKDGKLYGAWANFRGLLPLEGEGHDGPIVLNPDDFGQANPGVAKAFIRAFYGDGTRRMIGQSELYHDVRIIGTSNLHTHRAGAHRLKPM
jgi:transcriptional regulator of aromatic amino acid metabolism